MEILEIIVDSLSESPEWVFLYALPALVVAAAVGFVFTNKRRWFFAVTPFIAAAGFLLAYAHDESLSFVYLTLLIALCALASLLFFIPAPRARQKSKKSREEKMYEKFREELSEKPYKPRAAMPPKVCCFERDREDGATAQEYGVSLSYADTLLEKLRIKKLSAGDRLESEELLRRLDCYREKPLTESERSSLNDCLASILKLTAKYQL